MCFTSFSECFLSKLHLFLDVFCQNSYTDMCFIQNKEFYCKPKALKLGVPLYLKDKVEWDTSFGRVGHIGHRIVNVRDRKRRQKCFYLFSYLVLVLNAKIHLFSMAS